MVTSTYKLLLGQIKLHKFMDLVLDMSHDQVLIIMVDARWYCALLCQDYAKSEELIYFLQHRARYF